MRAMITRSERRIAMTNCPNCGAPIDSYAYVKCPYCNTDYFDFAPFDTSRPFFIKIKDGNRSCIAKVMLNGASLQLTAEYMMHAEITLRLNVINEIEANDKICRGMTSPILQIIEEGE